MNDTCQDSAYKISGQKSDVQRRVQEYKKLLTSTHILNRRRNAHNHTRLRELAHQPYPPLLIFRTRNTRRQLIITDYLASTSAEGSSQSPQALNALRELRTEMRMRSTQRLASRRRLDEVQIREACFDCIGSSAI